MMLVIVDTYFTSMIVMLKSDFETPVCKTLLNSVELNFGKGIFL